MDTKRRIKSTGKNGYVCKGYPCKLTETEIEEIKRRNKRLQEFKKKDEVGALAKEFGVSISTINYHCNAKFRQAVNKGKKRYYSIHKEKVIKKALANYARVKEQSKK